MGQWAVVLVDASGAIITRGRAVYVGPQGPLRSLRITVAGTPVDGLLRVGQRVRVRRTLHSEYSGVVTSVGTTSVGALTVTLTRDPH